MLSTQHFLHWAKKGDSHWVLIPGCMVYVVTPLTPGCPQSPAQCVVKRRHTKESLLASKVPFVCFVLQFWVGQADCTMHWTHFTVNRICIMSFGPQKTNNGVLLRAERFKRQCWHTNRLLMMPQYCHCLQLLKSHYFSPAFNTCWFLCFSWCFSICLTFVMHL